MKIKLVGQFPESVKALQVDHKFVISNDGNITLKCEQQDNNRLNITFKNNVGHIVYNRKNHFFRAFGLFLESIQNGETEFNLEETPQFNKIGPMFDLSRNAVMKIDNFKDMIRMLAVMGFDSAMLYMEDTYEVEKEPYFGYMRGRYSQTELKTLDDYAYSFGIELIPCIQTLAHLEEFLKWSAAQRYKDTRGALLLESEPTYELIRNMIQSVSHPFRSTKIHIGMDEAEEVGRGIYLNKSGYKSRFELMSEHLSRVLEITDGLGLNAMMWSDMFLKLASETGDQYSKTTQIPDHIYEQTPDHVQLMYWRYNETDVSHYEQVINQHKGFKKTPAFAGGIWVWNTFATHYELSLKASEAALTACKQNGVKDVYVTLWGDDGFENNFYTALLGLQYYAEHAYAKTLDESKLRHRIEFCTGIPADTFLLLNDLDTPPGVDEDNMEQTNPAKFLLWQDTLLGLFDKHVEGLDLQTYYQQLEQKIKASRNQNRSLDYIFDVPEKLASVLSLKGTIGVQLKVAYDNQDNDELAHIAEITLPEIFKRVKELRTSHRHQWLTMNKPFGWEVIDIRYGGVLNRLDTAMTRIKDFLVGDIENIEELEQERLYFGPEMEHSTSLGWNSYYFRMASPNVFFHVLPIY